PVNWRRAPAGMIGIPPDAAPAAGVLHHNFDAVAAALGAGGGGPGVRLRIGDPPEAYEAWLAAADTGRRPGHAGDDGDAVLQVYTSGTTGQPKAVRLPNPTPAAKVPRAPTAGRFDAPSVSLLATPLFHVGGLGWGLVGLYAGARTV